MRRVALALVFLGACGDDSGGGPVLPAACEAPVQGASITFRLIAQGTSAMLVTSPPADTRRFVVEQSGRIRLLTDMGFAMTPFLDISSELQCCGEQGLLGLAFHPRYATNGTFFVYYTTSNENIVARYQVSATDPNVADAASGQIILSIADFASNHNGGMIEFGEDGFLYIGTGDGGGGGDPNENGQNTNALLGKLLRIDVDTKATGKEYGIPPTNPFANEVFIYGLRNPWRWSFDRSNGDLYIGDVGQGEIEELTMIPVSTAHGKNFGWNMYEGMNCFAQPCDPANKVMPQFVMTHADGWCSVIGGDVYRGSCYPDIIGKYFFTDYCAHELHAATKSGTGLTFEMPTTSYLDSNGMHPGMPGSPASLHADSRGELFLTTTGGHVYQLEAGP